MSEERTTKIATVATPSFYYVQQCLCCENTRRLPDGMTFSYTPWICGECKEAIVFLKDFMKSCDKAKEILNDMENPNENIHPL